MLEDNKLLRVESTAVRLGRRYGDGMKSVPLLLELTDIVEEQTGSEPRPRAFTMMLIGTIMITGMLTSFIAIKQTNSSAKMREISSVPTSARSGDRRREFKGSARAELDRRSAPPFAANAVGRDVEPNAFQVRFRSAPHMRLARHTAVRSSGHLKNSSRRKSSLIAPYRNGKIAKPLSGKALQLALIEDRRLTREMNKASLRELRTKMQVD